MQPPELDADTQSVIDAARGGHEPNELARARVRRGVEIKIAAGVALVVGPASSAFAGAIKVTAAVVAVGAVVTAGAYVLPKYSSKPAPVRPVAAHVAPVASAPAPTATTAAVTLIAPANADDAGPTTREPRPPQSNLHVRRRRARTRAVGCARPGGVHHRLRVGVELRRPHHAPDDDLFLPSISVRVAHRIDPVAPIRASDSRSYARTVSNRQKAVSRSMLSTSAACGTESCSRRRARWYRARRYQRAKSWSRERGPLAPARPARRGGGGRRHSPRRGRQAMEF